MPLMKSVSCPRGSFEILAPHLRSRSANSARCSGSLALASPSRITCTTCALVAMLPSAVMKNPVPLPPIDSSNRLAGVWAVAGTKYVAR